MKSISTALAAHLAQPLTTLASCWLVTRTDGKVFAFTDHDRDLVISGVTYKSSVGGFNRSAVQTEASLAVPNLEVVGFFDDDAISEQDLRNGLFDHAQVRLFLVNWADLTQSQLRLRRGWLGEAVLTEQGVFRCELRGLMQPLTQKIGETFSYECRADLGDTRCKIPLFPPILGRNQAVTPGQVFRVPNGSTTDANGFFDSRVFEDRLFTVVRAGTTAAAQPGYDYTPGDVTGDGGAQLRCSQAWTRSAVVSAKSGDRVNFAVTFPNGADPRVEDNTWYVYGAVSWETGENWPRTMEVKGFDQATGGLALYLPMACPIQVGDRLTVYPGCDKIYTTCQDKFANTLNFRGEPLVPGDDSIMVYPAAAS